MVDIKLVHKMLANSHRNYKNEVHSCMKNFNKMQMLKVMISAGKHFDVNWCIDKTIFALNH